MAYGNTDRTLERRAVPIGTAPLTNRKVADLSILREKYLDLANRMVREGFVEDPLVETRTQQELQEALRIIQKSAAGFNQAYAEKVRLSVVSALTEQQSRYFRKLIRGIFNCGSKIEAPQSTRKYYFVPEAVQDDITREDFDALVELLSGYENAKIKLLRSILIDGQTHGLTSLQIAIVREVHRIALKKHRMPVYGKFEDRFTCQIQLDYRNLVNGHSAKSVDDAWRLLVDTGNSRYFIFIEISNPVPRGSAIRIPLMISRKLFRRLTGETLNGEAVKSLVVEIRADRVEVRAILAKTKPAAREVNECDYLIGRDFGYANTISLSVARRSRNIDPALLRLVKTDGENPAEIKRAKEKSLEYFQTHFNPEPEIVRRLQFSGKHFLERIEHYSRKIETLKSEIDLTYNKIHRYGNLLKDCLGLEPEELIPRDAQCPTPPLERLKNRFFRLLDHVKHLAEVRRRLYRKIRKLKKNWFGYLANIETALAREYNAAIVREKLTIIAEEKESPAYKGRIFNKMINNGSKGQYIRKASEKFRWNGIPEIDIPAFWTSSTCIVHGLVDTTMRKGRMFFCPKCKVPRDADTNASDTIANFLLLEPIPIDSVGK